MLRKGDYLKTICRQRVPPHSGSVLSAAGQDLHFSVWRARDARALSTSSASLVKIPLSSCCIVLPSSQSSSSCSRLRTHWVAVLTRRPPDWRRLAVDLRSSEPAPQS
mmetsp:Transcript_54194/g.141192  ORF Transcript_54194/g.141192 Transcript_54194/m.141192 type:complete len:107 (-) Transcript_54194:550-870(-)